MIDSPLWALGSACTTGLCILVTGYRILKTEIESIWLKIWPNRLPRGTSSLLVAAVYHPPSSVAEQNFMLIAPLQKNVENYLANSPKGMVIITGDLCELHTQDRMPLEQEKLFLCLPPQELTDLDIFAPSNTRITFKIAKCDMS